MADLTSSQRSFVETMTQDDEYATEGFRLLSKRDDPERFFDALEAAGLLDPSRNSGPVEATEPGYYRIPYWSALDYILALAKKAGEKSDLALAHRVMGIVRNVNGWRDGEGQRRDNGYTYWKFAEAFALLPSLAITIQDIGQVQGWFNIRFDQGMAGHTLVSKVLPKFLASGDAADLEKAIALLWQCTGFVWVDAGRLGKEVRPVVESHWLNEMIDRLAGPLGTKAGPAATDIFYRRLNELFGHEKRQSSSTLWRPAIEDHAQNHSFHKLENFLIDGLRDIMLAWLDTGDGTALEAVAKYIIDERDIVRRIAIYLIDERYDRLSQVFWQALKVDTFDIRLLHELYRFFNRRFSSFSESDKGRLLELLRQLPLPKGEDTAARLRRLQHHWLSAINGRGSVDADQWFAELSADPDVGPLSEHPDFLSYHEMRHGPGPSPLAEETIYALAEDGSLVETLNTFTETNNFRGPTLSGLCGVLEQAVSKKTELFLTLLQEFLSAKRAYQYSLLAGIKRRWEEGARNPDSLDWAKIWPRLFAFSEAVLTSPGFWEENEPDGIDLAPRREWIGPLISDMIQGGARDDRRGYAVSDYQAVRRTLDMLLDNSAMNELRETGDALNMAINSPKGRAVEALLNHSLKECRLSDNAGGNHAGAWQIMKPRYDIEVAKCKDTNFEFSALAANYLANIGYMDATWQRENISGLFPVQYPRNMLSALDGLAYAVAALDVYKLLRQHGVFKWALENKVGENAREKIVERIVLSYIWGEEALDGPLMNLLFSPANAEELDTAAQWLCGIRGEKLEDEQIERVLAFWDRTLSVLAETGDLRGLVRSNLSRLAIYLSSLDDRAERLLMGVAPYVHSNYNATEFVEQLDRLADIDAGVVTGVLGVMLNASPPIFDHSDRLKNLLRKLASRGHKLEAIQFTEILRKQIPGMLELYTDLVGS